MLPKPEDIHPLPKNYFTDYIDNLLYSGGAYIQQDSHDKSLLIEVEEYGTINTFELHYL